MSFLSFLQQAISTVAKVASTVTSVVEKVEPVIAALAAEQVSGISQTQTDVGVSRPITVGLVQFESTEQLMEQSLNLKRLETFLNFLASTNPSSINVQATNVTRNQAIWLHMTTTLIAEAVYLQQVLLTGSPQLAGGTPPPKNFNYKDTTTTFFSLAAVLGGYATDLAATVMELKIIAVFSRAGTQTEYTPDALGRTNDWSFTGITIADSQITSLVGAWDTYFKGVANGAFGDAVRQLS